MCYHTLTLIFIEFNIYIINYYLLLFYIDISHIYT